MKSLRLLPLLLAFVLAAALSYWMWRIPTSGMPMPSALKISERIASFADEPHSVAHPEARVAVREKLLAQLHHLGASPRLLTYPDQHAKGFHFDATNIVAEWPPLFEHDSATWLMLVAHYDSRYPWVPVRDTVRPTGAIDDGYGVAVTLECIAEAVRHRLSWRQGIRLLLTDAEEVGMVGMKCAWHENRELFDRVGLLINIEARGPYSPCVLFETSGGNAALIDLYARKAVAPVAYSITSAIYRMTPNYTDFTVVRDEIPGLNFAALADINYYHTDKDCVAHIDTTTLAHYGHQIYPIIDHYLTSSQYSHPNALRADNDHIFFTLPLFGVIHFSKGLFILCNAFLLVLVIYLVLTSRRSETEVARSASKMLLAGFALLVLGELLGYGCARIAGAQWKTMGAVIGIEADNAVMIVALCVLAISAALYVRRTRDAIRLFYGSLSAIMLLALLLLFTTTDNIPFSYPILVVGLTTIIDRLNHKHVLIPPALFLLALQTLQFLYIMATALTIGALGLLLFVAFFYLLLMLSLCKIYLKEQHR